MTDGYKPIVDERWRGTHHPYWSARCVCKHPRREHNAKCCMMGGCYCNEFRLEPLLTESGQLLPHSYA